MALQIIDGTGTGKLVRVNAENQMAIRGPAESLLSHISIDNGRAFGGGTPFLTVTATTGQMFWMKNTDSTRKVHFTDLWLNWNGGTTSHNRALEFSLYFGGGNPTGNNTASALQNLNKSSANTASATVFYWDEVGTGMTGSTGGVPSFFGLMTQGVTNFHVDGAAILGYNDTVAVNLRGEEVGEANISFMCFYE